MRVPFQTILKTGATISGVCGYPKDIFPQLIGKHIAFATQTDYFDFKYIVRVDSIEESEYEFTLHGMFFIGEGFVSSHSIGKECVSLIWVIDNYNPELPIK